MFLFDLFQKYRPKPQYPPYPPYHTGMYLEDYFYSYYYSNNIKTDRILIPISWTTLYIEQKTEDLQEALNSLDPNGSYFVVSQHDDAIKEHLPKDTLKFCAGGNSGGIPIPLVCSSIPKQDIPNNTKNLVCSFHGSLTHHLRNILVRTMKNKPQTIIEAVRWDCMVSKNNYVRYIDSATRSKFLLCPRGYGPHSFRAYESFQLGCVPVIISDVRFLPWEDELDWSSFCVFPKDIYGLYDELLNISDEQYNDMLSIGQAVYNKYFTLDTVCEHIIKRLV